MKKVVIAGSAKLQNEINHWKEIFINNHYKVLDYPKVVEKERFMELYPNVHRNFFDYITKTDMLFIMNEDKDGKIGYIGAETFAELAFGLAQKLVYNKKIELVIFILPSENIQCYEEIKLWLKLGWIKLYEEEK